MKKRILVVDDEPAIVRLLSTRLRSYDYEVSVAYNGHECVDVAKNEVPDLIFMDIQMPYCGGISAFELLIKSDRTNKIPVIFMTAFSKNDLEYRLLQMGAHGCISKPFINEDFKRTIEVALN